MTHAQEMVLILEAAANIALEMDASNESADIRYTDADAMNALLVFSHVVSNIGIHRMLEDSAPWSESGQIAISEARARHLAQVFREITGIDSTTYYHKNL